MHTYCFYGGLLASQQTLGFLGVVFLFFACFFTVHAVKLIRAGWIHYKTLSHPPPAPTEEKQETQAEKKEEKKTPAEQEPIYYIVERKRRRARPSSRGRYGEPKQISFK